MSHFDQKMFSLAHKALNLGDDICGAIVIIIKDNGEVDIKCSKMNVPPIENDYVNYFLSKLEEILSPDSNSDFKTPANKIPV
jgi:hypothetical protein